MRRRAILSYRGTCRRGDKRQIPTAGDAAPLKGKEEAVKEGQRSGGATHARGHIYELGKAGGLFRASIVVRHHSGFQLSGFAARIS